MSVLSKNSVLVSCAIVVVWAVRSAESGTRITSIQSEGTGRVALTWSDTNLHGYVVEQSTGWPWKVTDFAFVVPPPGADPADTSFTGAVGTACSCFYRIASGPPRDAFDRWDGNMGTPSNNLLFIIGKTNNEWFVQHGGDGDDSLYLSCGAGNDWVSQHGGGGNDTLTCRAGTENDHIFQRDEEGSNSLSAQGSDGDDVIVQVCGDGHDFLDAMSGHGNDHITMFAGGGNDVILLDPGYGDDVLSLEAGDGDDVITNGLAGGTCTARIDGGSGTDFVHFLNGVDYYTVKDGEGTVLYQTGTGIVYTLIDVEEIRYSLSLYRDVDRVDLDEGDSRVVPIAATAEQAGDTLTFRKIAGPHWTTVTGQGTVSAPDEFVDGRISLNPPLGYWGTTSVVYQVADDRGGTRGDAVLTISIADP